jgi:hypothetical protein
MDKFWHLVCANLMSFNFSPLFFLFLCTFFESAVCCRVVCVSLQIDMDSLWQHANWSLWSHSTMGVFLVKFSSLSNKNKQSSLLHTKEPLFVKNMSQSCQIWRICFLKLPYLNNGLQQIAKMYQDFLNLSTFLSTYHERLQEQPDIATMGRHASNAPSNDACNAPTKILD